MAIYATGKILVNSINVQESDNSQLLWVYNTGLQSTSFGTRSANHLLWNGSQLLVAGGSLATSTDGVTWTYQPGLVQAGWGEFSSINAIAWNGSVYLASSGPFELATSPDGVTWTMQSGLNSQGWFYTTKSVVWNGSQFLITGGDDVAISPDGVTWTIYPLWGSSVFNSRAVWDGSQYLATSNTGEVAISENGIDWVKNNGLSSTAWGPYAVDVIHWNGSQYLVAAPGTKVATSPDGVTWTYQPALASIWGTGNVIRSIIWDGSQYIVGGLNGTMATSPDGVTWTNQTQLLSTSWGTQHVNALTQFGSGSVIVAGSTGGVAISA